MSMRQSKKVSENVSHSFEVGMNVNMEELRDGVIQTKFNLSTKALLKVNLFDELKTYWGFQYSIDGVSILVGARLAGIKVLIPIASINNLFQATPEPEIDEYEYADNYELVKLVGKHVLGLSVYAFTAWMSARAHLKSQTKQAKEWKDELLPKLFSKHVSCLRMIKERAMVTHR